MMRKLGLLLVAGALALGAGGARPSLAQQRQNNEWLHCDIRGQVASFGMYNTYSYFRLKGDPRVFIFFKVNADAVATRMALVRSAYATGSTICFGGAYPIDMGEMAQSIPQVVTNFNTPIEKIVVPMMPYTTVYPAGTPGPSH